jgi:hypothetical protein
MASEDSARAEQSFLLIVRTRRIVTAKRSSAGFSGFPAYSQILLRQLLPTLGPFIVVAPPDTAPGVAGLITSSHGRP